jgi:predicted nucleotidyltransferase component of viral defense system
MFEKYQKQVELLLRVLPYIAKEECFALKGGTAINLFYQDLPRLSVDIDLTYIKFDDRATASKNITNALKNIVTSLNKVGLTARLQGNEIEKKIICSSNDIAIKIEPNYIMRGCLEAPSILSVNNTVEDRFFPVDMRVISKAEVYGGKICAALDRQHPRDLFDVRYLLEQDREISTDILRNFVAVLLSSNRPLHEIISPNTLDNKHILETEFKGMSDIEFTYEQHLKTLNRLIETVQHELKSNYKDFLLDFIRLKADLSKYGFNKLPAIQWKLQNLDKLRENNQQKFEEQYAKLFQCLHG